jgi:hypothetical protein
MPDPQVKIVSFSLYNAPGIFTKGASLMFGNDAPHALEYVRTKSGEG